MSDVLEPAIGLEKLNRVRVVLVETSHPGNVGSAARAMKTMGLSELVLVAPRLGAPHQAPEAVALAAGAADVLAAAKVVPTLDAALHDVTFAIGFTARRRDLSHRHVALREAAGLAMAELSATPPVNVALVFGNEAMCLANEDVDRCQLLAAIPANPNYSSLNLAQTVQVAAYEMMMAAHVFTFAPDVERAAASVGEVEALMRHFESMAVEADYLDPATPKRFMTRMRRLFTRAKLEPEEVAMLRGLLASTQKTRRM